MIQRKQTIFLILSIILFVLFFLTPFATFKVGTEVRCDVFIFGIQNLNVFNYMFVILQILTTLLVSLMLVTIFMYKKRPLQIRLCAFAFLLNVFIVGGMFLTTSKISRMFENTTIEYLLGTYIPLITLLFLMMAQRAIRKDHAKVNSLNRLR